MDSLGRDCGNFCGFASGGGGDFKGATGDRRSMACGECAHRTSVGEPRARDERLADAAMHTHKPSSGDRMGIPGARWPPVLSPQVQ